MRERHAKQPPPTPCHTYRDSRYAMLYSCRLSYAAAAAGAAATPPLCMKIRAAAIAAADFTDSAAMSLIFAIFFAFCRRYALRSPFICRCFAAFAATFLIDARR